MRYFGEKLYKMSSHRMNLGTGHIDKALYA
jgi:hypothetical protein